MIDALLTNEMAALFVPFVIFTLALWLYIGKKIGFGVMLTLLAFAVLCGLVIANYDMFQKTADINGREVERVAERIDELRDTIDKLIRKLDDQPVLPPADIPDVQEIQPPPSIPGNNPTSFEEFPWSNV